VRLARVALRLWRELEAESGTTLLTTTGQVTFGPGLDVLAQALKAGGAPAETMSGSEVTARFPALSVTTPALFEPESGVIAADECLAALGRTPGVEIRRYTRVRHIGDDGRRVRLVVEGSEGHHQLQASGAIVCAGPWSAPLVAGFGVGLEPQATLEQAAYLMPRSGSVADMPVFVERDRPWFYGLPVASSGVLKIALHGGGRPVPLADISGGHVPNDPDPALLEALAGAARRLLAGFDPEPAATERCLYDNSPDGDFIIDRVGQVVVGAGTSGHGFKFAPLLGEVLADRATGTPHAVGLDPGHDLARFAPARLRLIPGGSRPAVHP
jgi:sarcosine oxidase